MHFKGTKVGVLGTGDVGKALSAGFLGLGCEVKMGSRDPAKVKEWLAKAGKGASSGTFAEAASFGEIVVIATSWSGTENVIKLANPKNLAGKTVIDVTNPLDFGSGAPKLVLGHTDSAGEKIQKWLPQSKVVKAFNIVGNPFMVNPKFQDGAPTMFICGNDDNAKKTVTDILSAFKWETLDIGGIEGARLLEPLAMLWITHGIKTNTWSHAFKLLKK